MHRIGYLALVSVIGVLAQDAYQICKRCNSNYIMDRIQYPKNTHSFYTRSPQTRDFSYLPEGDYAQESLSEQEQRLNRDNRNSLPEYRNLCETVTKLVHLDNTEYEYQPPHYHEIYCKSYSLVGNGERFVNPSKQKCVHPGFHCVQRSKTILLVRRRWDSECWEPFVKDIASGCDCMWPVSVLGDITAHYDSSSLAKGSTY